MAIATAAPPSFDVRLIGARMLTPHVRELRFERVDAQPVTFQAGQWISLCLPLSGGVTRRAYSIASAPTGGPTFDLAITKVSGGEGSAYLHDLATGGTLAATGPQGFFTRARDASFPSLFVGTGTGITPLLSMVRDAAAHGSNTPMTLLVGVRHEEDQLYRDELDLLCKRHPNIRALYTLSSPAPAWGGLRGYVQEHAARLWHELHAQHPSELPHVYLCGLEKMVTSMRQLFREQLSADRKQVHSERYD